MTYNVQEVLNTVGALTGVLGLTALLALARYQLGVLKTHHCRALATLQPYLNRTHGLRSY